MTINTIHLLTRYWLFRQFNNFEQYGGKYKWNTLSHNGVLFPPEYIKHNIPILYKNKPIILDALSEEYATLYAKYLESEYIKSKVFNKNFWNDWKKILGKTHEIQTLEDCNFKKIYDYLLKQKELKKTLPKEIPDDKYKTALLDGKPQPVGNYRIEPPGIFLGRGCNPQLGKIKRRIYPEDIIINIGKESKIPDPLPNHKWKKVIHDRDVEWLASWKDDITGKTKYVWLGSQSDFKAQSDQQKFDLARKLGKKINIIRKENNINLKSSDKKIKQTATALYFIDNFALRVGNEKSDDEADTVGVTSLRVEHITLLDSNNVKLDFLGKDSVRYNKVLTVSQDIYDNLQEFMKDKGKNEEIFDKINSSDINKYLQSFMQDLTAKVFRTYNASRLFQDELNKISKKYQNYDDADKIDILLNEFNKANAKVAMLCNHQKNISKSHNDQLDKLNEQIKELKNTIKTASDTKAKKLKERLTKLKAKKSLKIELKNISLGTSKINYIDPRITISFMKRNNLPINKLFTQTLQDKFRWAFDIDDDYEF